MKTALTNVSDCRKELTVEIPTATVDTAIDRLSKSYGRSAKIPGFRPGKVPGHVVRTRYRDQILHDVARDLIPKAVDDALASEDVTPIATPEVHDVNVDEGKPLTFRATFETLPIVDPGSYDDFTLRQTPITVDNNAIDKAMEQLRERSARLEAIEGRDVEHGDTVTIDLERRFITAVNDTDVPSHKPERQHGVSVEIGNETNPPGFDDELIGLEVGATHSFTVKFPENYQVSSLSGKQAAYEVNIKGLHRRVVPPLDDDFAKETGEFKNLVALRKQVEQDLKIRADHDAQQDVRNDLLMQLSGRVTAEIPNALVVYEVERRVEQLARHMLGQQIDPRQANIDWDAFREQQRTAATDTVRSTLVLDAIASRETIKVTEDDINNELEQQAEASGRTASAVRALIEKEKGIGQFTAGLRREKVINFLLSRATIIKA